MIRQADLTADATTPRLTVAGLLQQYAPDYVGAGRPIRPNVLNTLARLSLCRTSSMGRRKYQCGGNHQCNGVAVVFNSCGERNCPQCRGARRVNWLERMAATILPGVDYFQIVLTISDRFSNLITANPATLYSLLMRSAWRAIDQLLQQLGSSTGATLVLHTWNQRLLLHPHLHALVPAGGLSLDGDRWISTGESQRNLLQQQLGKLFRDQFVDGIARLHRRRKLMLPGALGLRQSQAAMNDWLKTISPGGFRVLVQPPPTIASTPEHVLRYLARYLCGGPISNSRLVSDENGRVTFLARSLEKPAPGQPHEKVEVEISGVEFVQRWAIHILPKYFFRVRHYGRLSNPHRAEYLARCKQLLGIVEEIEEPPTTETRQPAVDNPSLEGPDEPGIAAPVVRCPKCKRPMQCIEMSRRPSWKITMNGIHRPTWYLRTRSYRASHPP